MKKAVANLTRSFDLLARVLMLGIMLLVVGNVIFRFFGRPFDGSYEWVGFLMGTALGLALGYSALQEGHVSINLLTGRFTGRLGQGLHLLGKLLCLAFLFLVARMLFLYGNRMLASGHVGMNTGVPLYYFAYIIAAGFMIYCLVLLYQLLESAGKLVKR